MSTDVIVHEGGAQAIAVRPANPLDSNPAEFRGALQRRGDNRKSLIAWVREALVDGVDFGAIPTKRGMSKPSLRKPGAEKICGMLNVVATFPTIKDYEAAALDGREIRSIVLRCHLLSPDGTVVADGIGARSLEQDQGDLNKALKMACKSAHIDATLRMAGLSEIFTQDLEDMPRERFENDAPPPAEERQHGNGGRAQQARGKPATQSPQGNGGRGLATEKQVKLVRFKLDDSGIPENEFLEQFGIDSITALPFEKVNEALAWIQKATAF